MYLKNIFEFFIIFDELTSIAVGDGAPTSRTSQTSIYNNRKLLYIISVLLKNTKLHYKKKQDHLFHEYLAFMFITFSFNNYPYNRCTLRR